MPEAQTVRVSTKVLPLAGETVRSVLSAKIKLLVSLPDTLDTVIVRFTLDPRSVGVPSSTRMFTPFYVTSSLILIVSQSGFSSFHVTFRSSRAPSKYSSL